MPPHVKSKHACVHRFVGVAKGLTFRSDVDGPAWAPRVCGGACCGGVQLTSPVAGHDAHKLLDESAVGDHEHGFDVGVLLELALVVQLAMRHLRGGGRGQVPLQHLLHERLRPLPHLLPGLPPAGLKLARRLARRARRLVDGAHGLPFENPSVPLPQHHALLHLALLLWRAALAQNLHGRLGPTQVACVHHGNVLPRKHFA
mmetsp:Transcript_4213/g.7801  ORF Transcript_4213/g.7801 Transcript_4213/m.7801 type:complete len:201 (+) Transcript_4213:464-1066(+)